MADGSTPAKRAKKVSRPVMEFDPINIDIELQHLNATVNLLRVAVETKRVEVHEYDMTTGTVMNSLWSLEWGLDRIKAEIERYMRDGTSGVSHG